MLPDVRGRTLRYASNGEGPLPHVHQRFLARDGQLFTFKRS
jgi:hypothetical protein